MTDRELRADPGDPGAPSAPGDLGDLGGLAALRAELAEYGTVAEVARQIDDLLVAEVPEVGADPAIRADLAAATSALASALADTPDDFPLDEVAVPEPVLDLVRTMARRRLDVTVVLRGIRVGHRLAWREVIRVLDERVEDPAARYAVLTVGWDRIATAIEAVAEAAVAAHTAEREAWLSGAHARRAETIAGLLAEEAVDADEATSTLGYRVLRRHLACVLWYDDARPPPGGDAGSALATAARAVRQHLGTPELLTVPDGTRSLSAWFGIDERTEPRAVHGVPLPAGVRLAAGLPAAGLQGFARSHHQAVAARRVAERSPSCPAVTSYDDVELVTAFLDRPALAADLVRRELGGLASADPATARLRATALAYLRAGGSARDAAALIGTHKNTVLYRLRAIDEALGHPVLERRLKLEVALTLVEHLGDEVLTD